MHVPSAAGSLRDGRASIQTARREMQPFSTGDVMCASEAFAPHTALSLEARDDKLYELRVGCRPAPPPDKPNKTTSPSVESIRMFASIDL